MATTRTWAKRIPAGAVTAAVLLAALPGCKALEQLSETKPGASAAPERAATSTAAAPAPLAPAPTAAAAAPAPAVDVDAKGVPKIPTTRSSPPTMDEWNAGLEVNTQDPNSRPVGCYLRVVREWLKVHCEGDIQRISDMENFGAKGDGYYEQVELGKYADFIVRLQRGQAQKIRIWRQDERASLFVNWPGAADRPAHIALGVCKPGMPCWERI
ncbi:MAG: hypothetical protein HY744_06270 [Deltaproteobacteria bacterium]|nr:hypothetical protein [Deltaproteobacteria bacterium]